MDTKPIVLSDLARERLALLRQHLIAQFENPGTARVGFDMGTWFGFPAEENLTESDPLCGTTACLAGHAVILFGQVSLEDLEEGINPESSSNFTLTQESWQVPGAEVLGLTYEQSELIFFQGRWPRDLWDLPPQQGAIRVLGGLLDGTLGQGDRQGFPALVWLETEGGA